MEENKICSKCKIEKPFSEFNKKLDSKDKLQYYCKSCSNQSISNWDKNNRTHRNKYLRKKYANEEHYKLAKNLRDRLRKALLKQLTKKNDKTEELLGISYSEFKNYIEFLMTPEITWKSVSLDHVQPLSSFNLTNPEQLKQASNYTNIQPLLKSDNCKKGSRLHDHDIAIQRNNVYEYEYYKYYCC